MHPTQANQGNDKKAKHDDVKQNEQTCECQWYSDEQTFESKIGRTMSSFKLSDAARIDQEKLNSMTHINTARRLKMPSILYVIGPPAVGKSTLFEQYAKYCRLADYVLCDADLARQCHSGIQSYLQVTRALGVALDGFFRYHIQPWTAQWKTELTKTAMQRQQNIVTFSTCHKYDSLLAEFEACLHNGYRIRILMICGEYQDCKPNGLQRAAQNGRKFVDRTYTVSLQRCIDVVEYLTRNRIIDRQQDLMVARNTFDTHHKLLNGDWKTTKNQILIPMKKRAVKQMYPASSKPNYNFGQRMDRNAISDEQIWTRMDRI